jgi:hypothetical protein
LGSQIKTPELIAEANRLRGLGLSYMKISKELGVSHVTVRYWIDSDYAEYSRSNSRKWKKSNSERNHEYNGRWNKLPSSIEKDRIRSRNWNKSNPEKRREHNRNWQKSNPGKVNAHAASRRRGNRKFTDFWSDETNQEILRIYIECPKGYQVDHIKPLSKGGWHHPINLQYLPELENYRKHNNFRDCDEQLLSSRLNIQKELNIPSLLLSQFNV